MRIDLPPLRERLDDLELLVAHFIAQFNSKFAKAVKSVSDDVMMLFRSYSWPGNVRELQHAIEHACILSKTSIITVADLPQDLLDSVTLPVTSVKRASSSQSEPIAKLTIAEALAASDGNKARAARLLGISRMTLYRQMGMTE